MHHWKIFQLNLSPPHCGDLQIEWRRNWRTYSKEKLLEELGKEYWNISINDSQNFYNVLENKLINIVDKLIPFKERRNDGGHIRESNQHMRNLIKIKKKKLRQWKRTRNPETGAEVKSLNKEIRKNLYEERKEAIRI